MSLNVWLHTFFNNWVIVIILYSEFTGAKDKTNFRDGPGPGGIHLYLCNTCEAKEKK
jgi:hypothetical protein